MKQQVLLLVFLLSLYSAAFSQSLSYQFPEKFSSSYDFKPDEAFQIYAKSTDSKNEEMNGYWIQKVYNTQFDFDYDRIYMNWNEPEIYLLKLMDTIIPDSVPLKKNLNAFITRDPNYNAYASSNGLFFVNVGLLAKVRNEAVLAHIIAHECGHYLLNHYKQKVDASKNITINYASTITTSYSIKSQKMELEADKYAANCVARLGYDLKYVAQEFENMDMKSQVYSYSRGYANMVKTSDKTVADIMKRKSKKWIDLSSHPEEAERMLHINKLKETYNGTKKFLIDSVFFIRLRKAAREECKRIYFDRAAYNSCLEIAFIDYLYEPKNVRNIYYIIESLRRKMYINPKLAKDPFLMEGIDDEKMFYAGQSILYKPDYLFTDFEEYTELKSHPFFSEDKKPFNTYEEAYQYFVELALKYNFNEANLSKALYYYPLKQQDSLNKYLDIYISKGNGLYTEYAKSLRQNGQPTLNGTKTFMLVDNVGNYTYYSFNYYLTKQRAKNNATIKQSLLKDSVNTDLVILNELMGKNPKQLFQFLKLENNIQALYTEADIQTFKKIRLSSKDKQDEYGLSHKFNKHFLVLAPEFYTWFNENNYSKLFFVETVHQSKAVLENVEMFNTYTGYYLDVNALRPYFKDAVRSGFNVKQTDAQIYADLADFLYGRGE